MKDFTHLVDLASARLGGKVLAANDEFFAPKENLLKPARPVFNEDKYTNRGKWMDGWETRRRRTPGHDWCIIRLGLPGILRGVIVDTSFFRGNYPSHCSVEACSAEASAPVKQLASDSTVWTEVLPRAELQGDTQNLCALSGSQRFSHLRLNIYPDGGVARLRIHGEVAPDWRKVLAKGKELDLACVTHGGRPIACSDMFFSHPQNLLMPYPAANMGDGWETRRRRGPGHDWVILQLGIPGTIHRVEVDTKHFKGNYPESCSLEVCHAPGAGDSALAGAVWSELLLRARLKPNTRHTFQKELREAGPVTHVRFNIFPDGGVSRLRIFGTPSLQGREAAGLSWLNAMDAALAQAALTNCCGSPQWVAQMLAARPFANPAQLSEAAARLWNHLPRAEWLEAFRHHPQIGGRKPVRKQSGQASSWSVKEQSGTRRASAKTLAALEQANRAYQARFGYIFIVCATGKTAEEMLALCRQRLANDPEKELRIAAGEQNKITRLRLERLIRL